MSVLQSDFVKNPLSGAPALSWWRLVAAPAAVLAAVAHMPILEFHLKETPYIGVGFLLLIVAGLLLSQVLLVADTRAVWTATLVVSSLALLSFVLSRTVGLPLIKDDIGNWADPLGIAALVGESAMLGASLMYFRGPAAVRS